MNRNAASANCFHRFRESHRLRLIKTQLQISSCGRQTLQRGEKRADQVGTLPLSRRQPAGRSFPDTRKRTATSRDKVRTRKQLRAQTPCGRDEEAAVKKGDGRGAVTGAAHQARGGLALRRGRRW